MVKPINSKPLTVLSLATLSFACLVSFGFLTAAWALNNCTGKCVDGEVACMDWCNAHNKTSSSHFKCTAKCEAYWESGKNPQSIGRSGPPNPSGPPRKGVGPVKLKNPPTTVSNPNSPTTPLAQIRTRQKK